MPSEEVKTANGNTKIVVGATDEALRAGVEAAKKETKTMSPDIDNPDDGNLTMAQFLEREGQADTGALEGPEGAVDEKVGTSRSSKDVAKQASADAGMLEDESVKPSEETDKGTATQEQRDQAAAAEAALGGTATGSESSSSDSSKSSKSSKPSK